MSLPHSGSSPHPEGLPTGKRTIGAMSGYSYGRIIAVRPVLKSLSLDPDPSTLDSDGLRWPRPGGLNWPHLLVSW